MPAHERIADYLQSRKDEVISLWREEARASPHHSSVVGSLDDKELEDHLPVITDTLIEILHGAKSEKITDEGRRHGHQRRLNGYLIVDVLRELSLFRNLILRMVDETGLEDCSAGEITSARRVILSVLDASTWASVDQYMLEAEAERNAARGEVNELHEQRDRFLITLSHELRNQLAPIILSVQIAADLVAKQGSSDRIRKTLDVIGRQARHQAILINDILEASRFRYGMLRLNREMIDLRDTISHAVETFSSDLQAKPLTLELKTPPTPVLAFVDKTRITEVFVNLLSNAIKFTPPNGAISIQLAGQGDAIVFRLKDTGTGIPADVLPHVFDLFYRGEERNPVSSGLGIGLSLAKTLVELHQGTIVARSEGPGRGAEFVVRIPVSKDQPDAQQSTSSDAKRILLVEDNLDHLEMLAELLEDRKYRVAKANDGFQALRVAVEHKPDVCLIDVGLPEMDGFELARRLRNLPQTRESRLIALSGYAPMEGDKSFVDAGFDEYLTKPANIEVLERILSR
jgi:signal transduction histidine kinase